MRDARSRRRRSLLAKSKNATVPTVLVVCPTQVDRVEIPQAAERLGVNIVFHGHDASIDPANFDADAFLEDVRRCYPRDRLAGVFASDDYPATLLASVIAHERHLPAPALDAVLSCADKQRSRLIQRAVAPEAVPGFRVVNAADRLLPLDLRFPLFAKPVKGFLSLFARRVDGVGELRDLLDAAAPYMDGFLRPWRDLSRRSPVAASPGIPFLLEDCLTGVQVTVEGYRSGGRGIIIGITDSVMYPGTNSFARFDLPSRLPAAVLARMAALCLKVIDASSIDNGLFNIELFYDPQMDRLGIIEVNPRMCPQFADLVEKLHGVNTYEIGLALALGRATPVLAKGGQYGAAASFVLREFEDRRVERLPGPAACAVVVSAFPNTRIRLLCTAGKRLSDEQQDVGSYRYALLNMGATDHVELLHNFEQARSMLDFRLMPISPAPDSAR